MWKSVMLVKEIYILIKIKAREEKKEKISKSWLQVYFSCTSEKFYDNW